MALLLPILFTSRDQMNIIKTHKLREVRTGDVLDVLFIMMNVYTNTNNVFINCICPLIALCLIWADFFFYCFHNIVLLILFTPLEQGYYSKKLRKWVRPK